MSVVKWLDETGRANVASVGGKGKALGVLTNTGFNVPPGFVIASDVFFGFLSHNGLVQKVERLVDETDGVNLAATGGELRELVLRGAISESTSKEVGDALCKLRARHVAIRSSAASEDSLTASFAGLHATFLNKESQLDSVLVYIKKCWASLFGESALAYRMKKGFPLFEGMAVIIQKMIAAEVSGVALTVHPSKEDALLIEASYGLGDLLVGGKVEPDSYVVDRETLETTEKRIGTKHRMSICGGEGVEVLQVAPDMSRRQAVTDEKIREIGKTALDVERAFGRPNDVEWCVSGNTLWVLQSRPIVEVGK